MIGLKRLQRTTILPICPGLNRTMIGLKHVDEIEEPEESEESLNRTMIGLKRTYDFDATYQHEARLNRTMIGLKL